MDDPRQSHGGTILAFVVTATSLSAHTIFRVAAALALLVAAVAVVGIAVTRLAKAGFERDVLEFVLRLFRRSRDDHQARESRPTADAAEVLSDSIEGRAYSAERRSPRPSVRARSHQRGRHRARRGNRGQRSHAPPRS